MARAPCRRLVVYDHHQAIYQFRHADGLRVLHTLAAVATRPLTQAWRYGEPLASAASQLVRHFKPSSHSDFAIRGSPRHTTRVRHAPAGPPFAAVCLAQRAQLVVLTRWPTLLTYCLLVCFTTHYLPPTTHHPPLTTHHPPPRRS